MADVLEKHTRCYATEELVISDERRYGEIPLDVMRVIRCLFGLHKLRLYGEEGYGLCDYGQLCKSMPLCLTALDITIAVSQPQSDIADPPDGHDTLEVFNGLRRLELLKVGCTWLKHEESDACRLLGDLELPYLQTLELCITDAKVVACDLSFTKIPYSCSVVCGLEVETESAKHRLQA